MKEVVIVKNIPKIWEEKHRPETGVAHGVCLNNIRFPYCCHV